MGEQWRMRATFMYMQREEREYEPMLNSIMNKLICTIEGGNVLIDHVPRQMTSQQNKYKPNGKDVHTCALKGIATMWRAPNQQRCTPKGMQAHRKSLWENRGTREKMRGSQNDKERGINKTCTPLHC